MNSAIPVYRESPHPCPYLPDQICSNLRFTLDARDPEFLDLLLENGFRHFGSEFFRPDCPSCQACVGIRISAERFRPSRAQRRCLKKNEDLIFSMGEELFVDEERIELLNAFQLFRSAQKDWPLIQYDEKQYRDSFFWTPGLTFEVSARDPDGRLVAAGIVDVTERSVSATYHYHDPAESRRGLGTWMILKELEWMRERGLHWLYLGLWNGTCRSLAYKTRFVPHQLLVNGEWTWMDPKQ